MLIVIWLIVIAIIVFGVRTSYDWDAGVVLSVVGGFVAVILSVFTIVLMVSASEGRIIDEKTALYEEENARIEEKIKATVKAYMEYEGETYDNLKLDEGSYIAAATVYPELASSNLVASQLQAYMENADRIRDLKAEKLSISVAKWWLYFGG